MNVLVVGKFYGEGFALHIAETLASMGHAVTRFEPGVPVLQGAGPIRRRVTAGRAVVDRALESVPAFRQRTTRRLLRSVQGGGTSLTIVCHDFLMPAEVEALRSVTGSPVVLWFPDSLAHFDRASFLAAPYDHLFFKDPYVVQAIRDELEVAAHYLPEAWNPHRMRDTELTAADRAAYGCDIATAGNLYSGRVAFFRSLARYDVKIWGNPAPTWLPLGIVAGMTQNRFVADQSKVKAFRAARIVINNLHPAEIWGVNARAFEICGAGGFQMVSWRPALDQLFRDGHEVVSYRGPADLREKIDHYLANESDRDRIARAGRARAIAEHTYEHRLRQMMDVCLHGGSAFPMPRIVCEALQ